MKKSCLKIGRIAVKIEPWNEALSVTKIIVWHTWSPVFTKVSIVVSNIPKINKETTVKNHFSWKKKLTDLVFTGPNLLNDIFNFAKNYNHFISFSAFINLSIKYLRSLF